MADVTIKYKDSVIAEMDDSGSKKLGTSGKYCEGDIVVDYVVDETHRIPKGFNIKYIIPCSYVPKRTDDGLGFAEFEYTFTRENVNQLFEVNWHLQDATDNTTAGTWTQHMIWQMCYTGNYQSVHNLTIFVCGHGKAGNASALLQQGNYSKTALSGSHTVKADVGSSAAYARNGQNYKGLLFIYDSTYTGLPIVDETKLSDFITCDGVTAGW